ncbi:hypothetical protein [Marivita hallyeonensis]|uniref:Uncharacterized protein n=1 Tax=Marivita hallyeonensis TaxID=996342 RepID=A0A1M5XZE4_9RHOB|nr:hypothetical protein [Marivita hallyeonensis]SHI05086.1 hypothetical protein SAMN05443551_4234 [Marivita hallyeonensis]
MSRNQEMFDERYRKVLARHRQLSRGYATKLSKNGLVTHYPIGHVRDVLSFSVLLWPLGILFFLKACIVTIFGEEAYREQVSILAEGTMGEQIGAFFLHMDPITGILAQILGLIIN